MANDRAKLPAAHMRVLLGSELWRAARSASAICSSRPADHGRVRHARTRPTIRRRARSFKPLTAQLLGS
jgi:hypothetical protein